MPKTLDVICLGRAAVDLYGQQVGGRLEDMQSFAKYVGGSSANVAVGLARLGRRSSMLTRVGDEHMGRFVREDLARTGVDVSHVRTDPKRLTAFVILGIAGEGSYPHVFFRENCADINLEPADFDAGYIGSSRALAITGTHLSADRPAAAIAHAVQAARAAGTRVVLDIDYRPVLWGLTSAGEGDNRYVASSHVTSRIQALLPDCDLIVGTEEEICIAGGHATTLESLHAIRKLSRACIVVKRGAAGCAIVPGEVPGTLESAIVVPGFPVEVLNVLGAGDAFLTGFLHGWLSEEPWERCGRLGNACGALVVSRHGCAPALPSAPELDEYLQRAAEVRRPDLDARIQHLHTATTTRRPRDELYVLAFDHRRQLEQLAADCGVPVARIARFKDLVASAVERVAARSAVPGRIGVIVDERYGSNVLSRMSASGRWIGRPVEVPGSLPVEFDPRRDTGLTLAAWPAAHVIKCLVFYHPDDPIDLRLEQEARIVELNRNALALERELLLEVIASGRGHPVMEDTVPRILRRFYNLGVRPAWWKLEPPPPAVWQRVSETIAECDPHCNGVLLLGLDAPEATLKVGFEHAAPFPICRGFAVGRSIFGEPAREWIGGRIDDERAVAAVAERYERLIRLWQDVRTTKGHPWPRSA
jgi:5-dehydro-2-deoxygluconokinase